MDLKELAVNYKHNGKNCAQAVMLALKDYYNLDENTVLKLTSGFGVGFGSMEATCGALIGANMVLGLNRDGSLLTMKESKIMLNEFKEKCKATICKDLKGVTTGKILCSCDDCVRNAVEIVLKRINNA